MWATKNQITLIYIQPCKPTQNAYIERFNRTVRQELFELNFFESISHAQHLATKWMWSYNNERPKSAIGRITPQMKLEAAKPLLLETTKNGGITIPLEEIYNFNVIILGGYNENQNYQHNICRKPTHSVFWYRA